MQLKIVSMDRFTPPLLPMRSQLPAQLFSAQQPPTTGSLNPSINHYALHSSGDFNIYRIRPGEKLRRFKSSRPDQIVSSRCSRFEIGGKSPVDFFAAVIS